MDFNKVIIAGRLTKAPELRATKSGATVASMTLASNRTWTDKNNQKQEEVEFHNVVLWGKQADTASKWLIRGQQALVEGRLKTRSYEGKDGQKRYVTEIVAENIQFGAKPLHAGAPEQASAPEEQPAVEEIPTINIDAEITAEELPF